MYVMMILYVYIRGEVQMKTTFREKVLKYYRKIVIKHRKLMIPAIAIASVFLFFDNVRKYLLSNYKRFFSMGFVLLFFAFSCSFSSAVFTVDTAGFTTAVSEPQYQADDSNATFAEEKTVDEGIALLDDEDVLDGYEDATNMNQVAKYSLDDIMEQQDFEDQGEVVEKDESSYCFDRDMWSLVLINKQHPVPDDYELHLGTIKGSMQCDKRIIPELMAMLQAAHDDGVELVICSPYRDISRQVTLFNKKINRYMAQGMNYMDAYKTASQAVTVPGASEHQVGLALDIISNTYYSLDEGFSETAAGKWLAEHSYEYGFILRYPKGKEYITSIEFEPWHFRYVGKEAAEIITKEQITLEEFWDKYL